MDRGRRDRKSDIYSTFIVHDDQEDTEEGKRVGCLKAEDDIYATMVYKDDDQGEDEDDDDDASLPPLLKRLPKDFGAVIGEFEDEEDEEENGDFGTMIVKPSRDRSSSRGSGGEWKRRSGLYEDRIGKRRYDDESDEEEEGDGDGGFSTFVVKKGDSESVSGTVVRKSGSGGGNVEFGGTTTMGRAVASMQAIKELGGGGKQKKVSAASPIMGEEGGRFFNRGSTSSLPESITREDPSTKFEMLNELGEMGILNYYSDMMTGSI